MNLIAVPKTDFLIVGAGVIGVCLSRVLAEQYPKSRILVIEKEKEPALHASGRNSGVLHAGFYYSANSLKAQFSCEGNEFLKRYCELNNLPMIRHGKLILAQSDEDLPQIDVLLQRAQANGVELIEIDEKRARELEPQARFYRRALWSPNTATVSPGLVVRSMVQDAQKLGVQFIYEAQYLKRRGHREIQTSKGLIEFGYLINCGGLYADRIALEFGFSQDYRLLPFKGVYLKSQRPMPDFLNRHIYPVPNLKNPFLGVHFTSTSEGYVKIGPTAMPAFWREQYSGFDNFSMLEMIEILFLASGLLFKADFDLKALAFEEYKKISKSYMLNKAGQLVWNLPKDEFTHWGTSGIRAQLLNFRQKKLEMDYLYEGDRNSFHVLNAVSPAFTCSTPFATHLGREIAKCLKH